MDLERSIIAIFCTIDDVLVALGNAARARQRGPAPVLTDSEVLNWRSEVMVRLREERLRQFLSIRELAKRAGVSPRTIVQAEAGRQVPYFVTARKIADALEVEPGEIEEFAVRMDEELGGKGAA